METIRKIHRGGGTTLLAEVDVTDGDRVVNFINDTIKFPTYVTSSYSGLGVKFVITFQAIQNYIPDTNGNQLPNTIDNSLKIFNAFDGDDSDSVPVSLFDITYEGDKVTINLKDGVTYPEKMVLPAFDANGKQITNISANFASKVTSKKIVVPAGYTSMDKGAFKHNSKIQTIDLSQSSITILPEDSFSGSSIVSVVLPEGLKEINSRAFESSKLVSINIPDSVTTIKSSALHFTHIQSLYIPASVSVIEAGAISSPALKRIVVDENNEYFYDEDDYALIANDGRFLYMAPLAPYESYAFTDNVTTISSISFYHSSSITSFNISKNIATISSFPPNIKNIAISDDNPYLSSVSGQEIINSNNELIKWIYNSDLTEYYVPDIVVSIKAGAFSSGNKIFNKLIINANCGSIADSALLSVAFNYIEVASGNQNFYTDGKSLIGSVYFYKYFNSNTDVEYVMPSGIQIITSTAFPNTALQTLTLPNSLKTIKYSAFQGCSNLKIINIPKVSVTIETQFASNSGVDSITFSGVLNDRACYSMANLKQVYFSNVVTKIGSQIFYNNPQLESIVFESTTPPAFTSASLHSGTTPNTFKIYVPDSAVETYKAVANLAAYKDRIYPVIEMA